MSGTPRVLGGISVRAVIYATAALALVGIVALDPAFEPMNVMVVTTGAILLLLATGTGAVSLPVWLGLFLPTAGLLVVVTWFAIESYGTPVAAGLVLAILAGAAYLIHRIERVTMGAVSES